MTSEEATEEHRPHVRPGTTRSRVAYLVLTEEGRPVVLEIPCSGEVIIGRDESAAVRIVDSGVSRRHARVAWQGPLLIVEDLGSRNGTIVNGEVLRAAGRRVTSGDALELAGRELLVVVKETTSEPDGLAEHSDFIAVDPLSRRVFEAVERVAPLHLSVFIHGEAGVGKEFIARAIHDRSQLRAGPFVRVACSGTSAASIEKRLFGEEPDAEPSGSGGLLGLARGGTLFLDDIAALHPRAQSRLLACLEGGPLTTPGLGATLGGVRFLAATREEPVREVEQGSLDRSLYHRLAEFFVHVPALRERPLDILPLALLFAGRLSSTLGGNRPSIEPEASDALSAYSWPGNVLELKHAIEQAVLVGASGVIDRADLPATVVAPRNPGRAVQSAPRDVKGAIAQVERDSIERALRETSGNRTHAARALGISLRSLLYKITKHGLK